MNGMDALKKEDEPEITKICQVIKIHEDEIRETTVEVCTESHIVFSLNGCVIGELSVTPLDLEAFTIGFLICEGYINSIHEITNISIHIPDISVTTRNQNEIVLEKCSKNSSGGPCRDLLPEPEQEPLPDGVCIRSDVIFHSMNKVNEYSIIWKRTGGMHCSLILNEHGEVISGVEDMGRHTTVDKAVGMALLKGTDLSRCYLVCSGRLPVDMVAKAYHARIPMVISNNAAFAGGIKFAKKTNMTLAGFVRPPNMTIYTGAQRIVF